MSGAPQIPFACPVCRSPLEAIDDGMRCESDHRFPRRDGFLDFSYPAALASSDAEFRAKYDESASRYDVGVDWLFRSFNEDEAAVRGRVIDLLRLEPGQSVLEIGCGTGRDSTLIAERIGPSGALYVSDLSVGMLHVFSQRFAGSLPVQPFVSNASYLPFPDCAFDAAFHFGAINQFGDARRALAEMTRVTRLGGRVVIGDEGVPPWLRERMFGRVLANANPLYLHEPPLAELPEDARNVGLHWILGEAFYVIDFVVADGPPQVDLDLPIPGKGDSLRSRFVARFGKEPEAAE